jgi:hypothetical protein
MGSKTPMLSGGSADVDGWLDAGRLALGWLGSPQAWPIINVARSSATDGRRLSAQSRPQSGRLVADRDRVMCAEA